MNDEDYLKAELRAVREELARREIIGHSHQSEIVAPRDKAFLRLQELTEEQLETHEEMLERDLEDLNADIDALEERDEATADDA